MKVNFSGDSVAAIPFFRRAVEIDPNFAMAYANLGLAYTAVGESVLSAESTIKAWQLRDRVSEREKFFIDFIYDREVTGNLEKAYQTLELWLQTYPRRREPPEPAGVVGGPLHPGELADLTVAIDHARKTIAAYPDVAFGYGNLAPAISSWTASAKPRDALQQAAARKLETGAFPGPPIQHRVLEGRHGADGSGRRSGQGQARMRNTG